MLKDLGFPSSKANAINSNSWSMFQLYYWLHNLCLATMSALYRRQYSLRYCGYGIVVQKVKRKMQVHISACLVKLFLGGTNKTVFGIWINFICDVILHSQYDTNASFFIFTVIYKLQIKDGSKIRLYL